MGTSREDISQILAERTGWTNQEINQAFSRLGSSLVKSRGDNSGGDNILSSS